VNSGKFHNNLGGRASLDSLGKGKGDRFGLGIELDLCRRESVLISFRFLFT
jgi:hypothetical protein